MSYVGPYTIVLTLCIVEWDPMMYRHCHIIAIRNVVMGLTCDSMLFLCYLSQIPQKSMLLHI